MDKFVEKINLLTPTFVLVVSTLINHVCKENKQLTTNDFLLILSPTIPTILPIFVGIFTQACTDLHSILFANEFFSKILPIVTSIISVIPMPTNLLKSKPNNLISNNENDDVVNISLIADVVFMQSFVNYILDKKNDVKFSIEENNLKLKIENTQNITETQIWNNISMKYEQLDILAGNIEFKFNRNGEDMILVGFSKYDAAKNSEEKCKIFKTLADFIDNANVKKYLNDSVALNNDGIKSYKFSPTGTYIEHGIINLLKKYCPNLDEKTVAYELVILDKYNANSGYSSGCSGHIFAKVRNYATTSQKFKIFNYEFPYTSGLSTSTSYGQTLYDNTQTALYTPEQGTDLTDFLRQYYTQLSSKSISVTDNGTTTIDFKVKKIATGSMHTEFMKFVKKIQSIGTVITEGKKIKIFNVKVERKEAIKTTENPEYAAYLEKKETISKMEKSEQTNFIISDFFRCGVPQKEFIEKVWEPIVVTTQINEKYKSLHTTYLREKDTKNLVNILNNFKNNQKLFLEYGLPNKLGILLYGEPGTGKTTAIHAVASYLQKDIYYVNLSTIESNEELQLVFDQVNLKSANGGIIVFEDVDAMTTIVHDRSQVTVNNSKLTLEYFLNLLQGSLTRDGTIFIATTNHIEKLDPAFCRVGRFDVKIEMKKCDHYQIRTIYNKFVKKNIEEHVLESIEVGKWTPADIIFHLINYIDSDEECNEILKPFLFHEQMNCTYGNKCF